MLQRKVCLVGDFAVGKSSLFNRFVYSRFSDTYLSTVGVRIQRKVIHVHADDLALILWDTEGGRERREIKESYITGAVGAIIACDLTRVGTILHCEEYAQLLRHGDQQMQIVLAGNKVDLVAPDHPHLAVIRRVAQLIGASLTLTSASSGDGVELLFQSLGETLFHARTVA